MNTSRINTSTKISALLAISLATVSLSALADGRDHGHGHDGWVLDHRYNHDHYYPPRGYVVRGLPRGAVTVRYSGSPYYFHEGVWYRPGRFGYAVVGAPIGAFLPILPPYYSTVWFGGVPYYYADDVYYLRDSQRNGYVVTAAPSSEAGAAPAVGASEDMFTYPKNGQSSEQQATDRYECHRWAADQTGFDVTQPQGGVSDAQLETKRADYRRAQTACLEGRGYTVK